MPREIDAAMLGKLTATPVQPRFFLEIELDDGSTINYWTGEQDVDWNSKTWLANGFFKSFDQIKESQEQGFSGISVELAGEPSVLIAALFNSLQRYRTGSLYFGFVNDVNAVTSTPVRFTGSLDSVELNDGVEEAIITLKYVSDLMRLERSVDRRFNQQSQQIDYPSDIGFEFIEKLKDFTGLWKKFTKPTTKKKNDPKNKNKNKKQKNRGHK